MGGLCSIPRLYRPPILSISLISVRYGMVCTDVANIDFESNGHVSVELWSFICLLCILSICLLSYYSCNDGANQTQSFYLYRHFHFFMNFIFSVET